jgi:hypothetical protein
VLRFDLRKREWTPHDLRRRLITAAEQCGVHHPTIKRLVNDVAGRDVTSGYILHDLEYANPPSASPRTLSRYLAQRGSPCQQRQVSEARKIPHSLV